MSRVLSRELSGKVDDYLDNQERQQAFAELGRSLYQVFGIERSGRKRLISAQLRNLQQVVMSAERFSDIEIFIKSQMGKGNVTADKWMQVGQTALDQLGALREQGLPAVAAAPSDEGTARKICLALARGWVGAVAGEYLYAKACEELPVGQQTTGPAQRETTRNRTAR